MKSKSNYMIKRSKALGIALAVYALTYAVAYAQDGNAGINEATARVN
jgi:hypothetical protein